MNMAAAAWKARKLNEVLPALQSEFENSLNRGVVLQLGPGESSWLDSELEVDVA